MNPSARLSPIKLTPSSSPLVRNYSHLYLPRNNSSSFFHVKPNHEPSPPKRASFAVLRTRSLKLSRPFALIVFRRCRRRRTARSAHQHRTAKKSDEEENELGGMAQAFHISSATASAIKTCTVFAALTFPFLMSSLRQGLALKTKVLSYGTLLFGFYMAWNIGANDVANAMGTSVGSGALSLRQAVLEF